MIGVAAIDWLGSILDLESTWRWRRIALRMNENIDLSITVRFHYRAIGPIMRINDTRRKPESPRCIAEVRRWTRHAPIRILKALSSRAIKPRSALSCTRLRKPWADVPSKEFQSICPRTTVAYTCERRYRHMFTFARRVKLSTDQRLGGGRPCRHYPIFCSLTRRWYKPIVAARPPLLLAGSTDHPPLHVHVPSGLPCW
jgi:hypothetical protein